MSRVLRPYMDFRMLYPVLLVKHSLVLLTTALYHLSKFYPEKAVCKANFIGRHPFVWFFLTIAQTTSDLPKHAANKEKMIINIWFTI